MPRKRQQAFTDEDLERALNGWIDEVIAGERPLGREGHNNGEAGVYIEGREFVAWDHRSHYGLDGMAMIVRRPANPNNMKHLKRRSKK